MVGKQMRFWIAVWLVPLSGLAVISPPKVGAQEDGRPGQLRGPLNPRPHQGDGDEAEDRVRRLSGHAYPVSAVAISPDGAQIVSGSRSRNDDPNLILWDATSGRKLRELEGHPSTIFTVAFSPDGQLVAAGGWAREVKRYTETKIRYEWHDGLVKVWEASTGRVLQDFEGHQEIVQRLAFDSESRSIVSLDREYMIRKWGWEDGEVLSSLDLGVTDPQPPLSSYHPSEAFDASIRRGVAVVREKRSDRLGYLKKFDLASGEIDEIQDHRSFVCAALRPDGEQLVAGTAVYELVILDFETGTVLRELKAPAAEGPNLKYLTYSPDGTILLSGDSSGEIRVWDMATGRSLQTIEGPKTSVRAVAFLRGGALRVVSGGYGFLDEKNPITGGRKPEPLLVWDAELEPAPAP